jgi:hypothetical protein
MREEVEESSDPFHFRQGLQLLIVVVRQLTVVCLGVSATLYLLWIAYLFQLRLLQIHLFLEEIPEVVVVLVIVLPIHIIPSNDST